MAQHLIHNIHTRRRENLEPQTAGWFVTNKWWRMWKKASVDYFQGLSKHPPREAKENHEIPHTQQPFSESIFEHETRNKRVELF
jgi:hypothetical protein